jgi:CheY-like chemotaxis protein
LAKPALREALAGVLKQYRAWLQDGAAIRGAPSEVLLESRRVTAAGTGALSAVRSLLDKRQGVIVLDLQIPSSELLEFVDSVGRLPGISGTQVVALVGLSIDPADEAQLQENGIAILSTRDRPPSEIREAIERLASREPVLAGG